MRRLDECDLPDPVRRALRLRAATGNGGLPIVGDPDRVAKVLTDLSAVGIDAFAMGFANCLQHFPYFRDEVQPRLADAGLRPKAA